MQTQAQGAALGLRTSHQLLAKTFTRHDDQRRVSVFCPLIPELHPMAPKAAVTAWRCDLLLRKVGQEAQTPGLLQDLIWVSSRTEARVLPRVPPLLGPDRHLGYTLPPLHLGFPLSEPRAAGLVWGWEHEDSLLSPVP